MRHVRVLAALLVLLLAAACGPTAAPEVIEREVVVTKEVEKVVEREVVVTQEVEVRREIPPLKIGHMGPLTGGAAFLGQEQLNFTRVAVEIFNEESGLNVQLVEGDTMIDPDEGKLVAERFVADLAVYGVVGPAGSQVCEVTQPVFLAAGLVHLTPSCTRVSLTAPETEAAGVTFFRPIPHDGLQGPTDAAFMVDVVQASSAYLVDDQSSYSVGLTDIVAEELEARGAGVQRASVTQDQTDFTALATTITAANPDVVFFPGQISSQLGTLIVQLRQQGWRGTYFLGDGGFDISWVETAGADVAEGTYLSFFAPDPHNVPAMAEYNARYSPRYGEFGAFGGPSALAARLVLEALLRCVNADDVTRECVRSEVATTEKETSILGIPVSFDENGQLVGGVFFIYQVQGGQFILVGP